MQVDAPGDVTGRIDETLDAATKAKTATAQATSDDTGDPVPDSLEARIRLLTPGHTYWTQTTSSPEIVNDLAKAFGVDTPNLVSKAVWSTPGGIWMLGFQLCSRSDPDAPTYHLSVDYSTNGNGIDIYLEGQTPDEVIAVLTSLHAIRG